MSVKYDFDQVPKYGGRSVKWDTMPDGMLPFYVAVMDFDCAPEIVEAVSQRAAHSAYGYSYIDEQYYKNVHDFYARHHEMDIPVEDIMVSPGIISGFCYVFHLITKPGDGVVIQPPVYGPFYSVPQQRNLTVVENPLLWDEENGYRMDYEDLERKCADPANKVLMLCSPHNPIGRVWKPEELIRAANIALDHDMYVLCDEIHCDLLREGVTHYPLISLLPEKRNKIITTVAPSKTFNIPGLSMAHVMLHDAQLKEAWKKYVQEELHLHFANPLNMAAVDACHTSCDEWLYALRSYLQANMEYACRFFKENLPNVSTYVPEGTYLMWLDMRKYGLSSEALCEKIKEQGAQLSPGTSFGHLGEGFMRFNVGCTRATLTEGLSRIKKALDSL